MPDDSENFVKRTMAGQGGAVGGIMRGLLRAAEPLYSAAVTIRNKRFDSGKSVVDLGKPTISIGNITSGGTGKTPTVRWLCDRLIRHDIRPAVLMRGYKAADTGGSDEQRMLDAFLGSRGAIIEANPDRVAGAQTVLNRAPDIGAFVLDDGFQHRRVKRDLDIVLINALEPFGFEHVLPRGLLREPLTGLQRAGAIIVTHARSVSEPVLGRIKLRLNQINAKAPVYYADHGPVGFRTEAVEPSAAIDQFDDALRDEPVLAFCGLGSPQAFNDALTRLRTRVVAHRWFNDHHAYTAAELEALYEQAVAAGAKVMVTTEKDWTKLKDLPRRPAGPAIWRLDVAIRFWYDQEREIMDQVRAVVGK
jgi:tetraacyldisaccharide 4'-kinase